MRVSRSSLTFGGLVLLTTALMGSSFAIGKIGLAFISPFLLVGLRFVIAGGMMALWVRHQRHPQTRSEWGHILIIGLFQTTGVMGLIFLSLKTISAAESSILTFTNPLLVVILATAFAGARYRIRQWLGVAMGFGGVLVTLGGHLTLHAGTVYGFSGALSWAIATLLIKRWGPSLDIWVLTAYQMLFGGIVLLMGSVVLETPMFIITAESVFVLLWLAVMASVVQFGIWFYLLQHGDPGRVSTFLFLAPFFGVLFGWLLLQEPIAGGTLIGGSLIILGIALVNWPARITT